MSGAGRGPRAPTRRLQTGASRGSRARRPAPETTRVTLSHRLAPRFNGGRRRRARPRPPPPSGEDAAAQGCLRSARAAGRGGGGRAGAPGLACPLHTCRERGGVPAAGGPVSALLVLVLAAAGRRRVPGQRGRPLRPQRAGAGELASLLALLQEGVLVGHTCKHRADTGVSRHRGVRPGTPGRLAPRPPRRLSGSRERASY